MPRSGLLKDVVGLRTSGNKYTATSSMTRGVRALGEPLVERTLEKVRVNPSSGHASETASTEDLRVTF